MQVGVQVVRKQTPTVFKLADSKFYRSTVPPSRFFVRVVSQQNSLEGSCRMFISHERSSRRWGFPVRSVNTQISSPVSERLTNRHLLGQLNPFIEVVCKTGLG